MYVDVVYVCVRETFLPEVLQQHERIKVCQILIYF